MSEKIGEAYVEATIRLGKLRSGLRNAERMATSSVSKIQRSLNSLSAAVKFDKLRGGLRNAERQALTSARKIQRNLNTLNATIKLDKLRSGLRQAERMVTSSVAKMQRSLNTLSARVGMGGAGGIGAGRGAGGLLGAGVAGGVAAGVMKGTLKPLKDIERVTKAIETAQQNIFSLFHKPKAITSVPWSDPETLTNLDKARKRFDQIHNSLHRIARVADLKWFKRFGKGSIGSWAAGGSAGSAGVASEGPFGPTMWNKAQKAAKAFYKKNKIELKRMGATSGGVYRSMQAFYKRGIKDTGEIRANLEKVYLHKMEQRGTGFYPRKPGEAMGAARFGFDDPESFKRSKKMARAAARQREQDALREKRMQAEWKALQKQYQTEHRAAKSSKARSKVVDKTTRVIKARANLRKRQEVIEHLKAVKDWKIAATQRKLAAKQLFERRPELFPKGISTEQKPWVVDRRRKEANRWEKERRLSELMNAQKALKQQKAIWDKQAAARKKFDKYDLPGGMGAAKFERKPSYVTGAIESHKKLLDSFLKTPFVARVKEWSQSLVNFSKTISGKMGKALRQIPGVFNSFAAAGKKAMRGIKIATKSVGDVFKGIGSKFAGFGKSIGGFFNRFKNTASAAFGKIKKLWTGASKAAKGFALAIAAVIVQSTRLAMANEHVKGSFIALAGGTTKANKTLAAMKKGFKGTVLSTTAMIQANQAMMLNVANSAKEFGEFATLARRLGKAVGRDALYGMESLTTGIGRQSIRMLDNLGIIVDTRKAYETYAKTLGKNASALSEVERKEAFKNAAMKEARMLVNLLGEDTDTTTEAWRRFITTIKECGITLGGGTVPILAKVLNGLTLMVRKMDEAIVVARDFYSELIHGEEDWAAMQGAKSFEDKAQAMVARNAKWKKKLVSKEINDNRMLADMQKKYDKEKLALQKDTVEKAIAALNTEARERFALLEKDADDTEKVAKKKEKMRLNIASLYAKRERELRKKYAMKAVDDEIAANLKKLSDFDKAEEHKRIAMAEVSRLHHLRLERERVIEERLADIHIRASQRKLEKEKEFRSMIESEQEKLLRNTGKTKQAEYLVIKRHYDKLSKEHRNNAKVLKTIEEWRQAAIRNMFKKKEEAFKSEMLGPTGLWEKAMTISLSESEQKTMVKLNETQLSELVLIKAGVDALICQGKEIDLDE